MLVFGVSRSPSTSTGYGASAAEIVRGFMVTSGGMRTEFAAVSKGSSMTIFLGTMHLPT